MIGSLYESHWILATLLAVPLVGALACFAAPAERAKGVALATTLVELALALPLFWTFEPGTAAFQNGVSLPWIETWGIRYAVGLDGISLLMVLLTAFVMPLAVLGSFAYIRRRQRSYYALMLLLQVGMLGVFVALDLFLFYVFWEVTLIPMYFIIGVWGSDRRVYSAVKFILYTAAGSLLMLVAIVALVALYAGQAGEPSFAYQRLLELEMGKGLQLWLFGAFALAFAIKVPLFPFHTWLPDAHVDAPTAGSVILAGVLLKLGGYGFLRYALPLFPDAATDPAVVGTVMALGLVGILYGAWVAAVQPDAKKLVAYTSVAHMGFVMLGLFAFTAQGLQGGILQMVNHGISTGALFLLIGMLYERRHTRAIADFGGLARVMPAYAVAFVVVALSSIGLPGTNGFVGEFLILLGTFRTHPITAAIATAGVIFAACYMLPMVQRILLNRLEREENRGLADLSGREMTVLAPVLALILLIGVHPTPFLSRTEASVDALIARVEAARTAAPAAAAAPAGRAPPGYRAAGPAVGRAAALGLDGGAEVVAERRPADGIASLGFEPTGSSGPKAGGGAP